MKNRLKKVIVLVVADAPPKLLKASLNAASALLIPVPKNKFSEIIFKFAKKEFILVEKDIEF